MEYIRNTSEVVSGLQQVFIPMGGDFQYISGEDNYQWMDDLIHRMNMKISKYRMHFMYSTPHCYLKALMAEEQVDIEFDIPTDIELTELIGQFGDLMDEHDDDEGFSAV